jgi:hypothetical protein
MIPVKITQQGLYLRLFKVKVRFGIPFGANLQFYWHWVASGLEIKLKVCP